MTTEHDPHTGQPVLRMGPDARDARLAVILVHGRGASAEDILNLAQQLRLDDVLYLAPQAAGNAWYPYSFLSPMAQNEPSLSSALNKIHSLVATLGRDQLPPARVALMGFSQGACVSLEYAARHAQRYAAVVGLSGGVIGPPGTPRDYAGSMDGTPVLLGCSDIDAHVPVGRVHESTQVFERLHAVVDERIYPGMGHTVNEDEIAAVRALFSPQGS
ncbi:MAG: alpha/beta fold hydrolase [Acidobacteria bacterium]|nr:alpha/beta fold hydrolase [Acidobacteriota bacterium]